MGLGLGSKHAFGNLSSLRGFDFCVVFGFGLGVFGVFFLFAAVEVVNKAYKKEHGKGDDKEIDDVLDEITNCNVGGSVGAEEIGDID